MVSFLIWIVAVEHAFLLFKMFISLMIGDTPEEVLLNISNRDKLESNFKTHEYCDGENLESKIIEAKLRVLNQVDTLFDIKEDVCLLNYEPSIILDDHEVAILNTKMTKCRCKENELSKSEDNDSIFDKKGTSSSAAFYKDIDGNPQKPQVNNIDLRVTSPMPTEARDDIHVTNQEAMIPQISSKDAT